jgi:TPR repeat protein
LDPEDYPPELIGRYDEARSAFQKGETAKATAITEQLAQEGFAPAQHALGALYIQSDAVDNNPELARKWLLAAADGGHTNALFLLGSGKRPGLG